jgi:hypothetical protein
MRTLLLLVILFIGITQLPAQKPFKRTTLYGEIAGSGLTLSLNYERQLSNKPGLGLYVGIGLGGDDFPFVIPVGAKYIYSLGGEKSFLEVGAGVALAENDFLDDKFDAGEDNDLGFAFIPTIGYRHHARNGFMWRLNYTPLFSPFGSIPYLFGISLGWRI